MTKRSPFRHFKTSPEIIRLAVMFYVRFPLSLRNVEDLLHERGIDASHETVRYWWNRFGPMFAAEIRRKRVSRMRCNPPRVKLRFREAALRASPNPFNGRNGPFVWLCLRSGVQAFDYALTERRLPLPQLKLAGLWRILGPSSGKDGMAL